MSHIAVEGNKRKKMTEHLKVLRSLTPCFYIKRGDQASIIWGVIEFIKELQQLLQAMESKKQRKRLSPSPRPPLQLIPLQPDPNPFGFENFKELAAGFNSSVADVEARISGSNVILKVVCRPILGQIVRIINVLERFFFEILHLNISSLEDNVLYSFVVEVRLECRLSVEELVLEVHHSCLQEPVYADDEILKLED